MKKQHIFNLCTQDKSRSYMINLKINQLTSELIVNSSDLLINKLIGMLEEVNRHELHEDDLLYSVLNNLHSSEFYDKLQKLILEEAKDLKENYYKDDGDIEEMVLRIMAFISYSFIESVEYCYVSIFSSDIIRVKEKIFDDMAKLIVAAEDSKGSIKLHLRKLIYRLKSLEDNLVNICDVFTCEVHTASLLKSKDLVLELTESTLKEVFGVVDYDTLSVFDYLVELCYTTDSLEDIFCSSVFDDALADYENVFYGSETGGRLKDIKGDEGTDDSVTYKLVDNFRDLNRLAENRGYKHVRSNGDHAIFRNKDGYVVVIPQGRSIGKGLSIKIQKTINSTYKQ